MMTDHGEDVITVSLSEQRLSLRRGTRIIFECAVSTAKNGAGEINGSECTPRGWHEIRAKIGVACAANTVFVGRRVTGEIYQPAMAQQQPGRDWILTRILWLSGLEKGRNRLGNVDTMCRYIYIHGCPEDVPMGIPGSHGCIRMHNRDVIALFDLVSVGTQVLISELNPS